MKEKFIEFLKAHNAYDQYVLNAKEDHGATLDGITRRNIEPMWISAAFDWGTGQKFEFWRDLSEAWEKEIGYSGIIRWNEEHNKEG